ncbi:MAG: adenylate cyclase, partial [Mycobacterium sp.]|nr:adenylate cyclase [Mycobacterium sp.]
RGEVDIKGKGVMHTWYLIGRRDDYAVRTAVEDTPGRASSSSSAAVTSAGRSSM